MDERPFPPDPNALTQPIPVVPVAPPPRPSGRPSGRPSVTVAAPYVHRFGSIPWYLFARFAAFVLDYFGVAFVAATFGFHAIERGLLLFAGRSETGFGTLAALSFGFAIVFAFACEALFGTTLGKLVFALHVRRRDGRHAGGLRAFARALLRPIDLLVVGPLLALVTPRHQRLGDMLAGTVVAGSRLGAFASIVGLLIVAAIGYAQVTFGGGLTSAIGVAAETADYAPAYYARAAGALGFAVPSAAKIAPAIAPAPQAEPSEVPTPAPASSGTSSV